MIILQDDLIIIFTLLEVDNSNYGQQNIILKPCKALTCSKSKYGKIFVINFGLKWQY